MEINEIAPSELDRMRAKTKPIAEKFSVDYDPALVKLFNSELDRVHALKL